MVETSGPSRWGCCRSSGRRQRSEAGARIPRVGGRCRNLARVISHSFGLWAVDGVSGGWLEGCGLLPYRRRSGDNQHAGLGRYFYVETIIGHPQVVPRVVAMKARIRDSSVVGTIFGLPVAVVAETIPSGAAIDAEVAKIMTQTHAEGIATSCGHRSWQSRLSAVLWDP